MWTSPGPDPGWAEHRTAQNSLQIKTEKSFTSGIFHFMFSVPETSGSGVGAEGRVTSVAGFPLQALLKVFGCVTASHGAGANHPLGAYFRGMSRGVDSEQAAERTVRLPRSWVRRRET